MVGTAIKKYANEKGLKISHGVAYGVIGGYMATFVDGEGIKKVSFSCLINEEAAPKINYALTQKDFMKQYRIGNVEVVRESVSITFTDTVGTMKKIIACMDVLPGILKENGAIGDGVCTTCGNYINAENDSNIVLINGVVHRIHKACAAGLSQRSEIEKENYKNEEKFLGRGILGAVLGSMLGGLVWAVAYYFGWFIAVIGALIGVCAKKGYELLGGKTCKAKTAVILITTLFGAVFGQVLGDCVSLVIDGAQYGYTFLDVPFLYVYILTEDSAALSATLSNLGMGLLFAVLGAVAVLKKTRDEHKGSFLDSTIIE